MNEIKTKESAPVAAGAQPAYYKAQINNASKNSRIQLQEKSQTQIEAIILNRILIGKEIAPTLIDLLEPEDFTMPLYQRFFSEIKKLHQTGKKIDSYSVAKEMNIYDTHILINLVDLAMMDIFVFDKTVLDLAKQLKERKIRQRLPYLELEQIIQEIKKIEEFEQKEENNSFSLYNIVSDPEIDPKIKWIIPDFLPEGGITDVFGGPESGKTTFLLTLLISLASQVSFYPFSPPEKEYKTLIVGGEKNSLENWKRSICFALQTLNVNNIEKLNNLRILDTFSDAKKIENKYLLKLNEKEREWEETKTWQKMIYEIEKFQPDILLFDTLSACFLGYTPNLWAEHQKLLLKLSVLAKQYNLTILTVSHTNQQSRYGPLWKRLDLAARSGNTEIPGELRCFIAFSSLNPKEILALKLNPYPKYITICNAKTSEFKAKWTQENPLLFQINEGQLDYITEIDTIHLEKEVKGLNRENTEVKKTKPKKKKKEKIEDKLHGWTD